MTLTENNQDMFMKVMKLASNEPDYKRVLNASKTISLF